MKDSKLEELLATGIGSKKMMRKAMIAYAQHEVERLMKEHLSQNWTGMTWCFSPDLGGAVESGFAWAEYVYDLESEEDTKPREGKCLESLLERVSFEVGNPDLQRWVAVGELK